MLMRDPTKKGGTAAPTSLTAEEKKDKVRILTDWVLYTPRSDFRDEWGKPAIKTEEDYFKVLLAKIRGANNVQESLKSQSKMLKVAEDDDWGDGSYNATTLRQVIKDTWKTPLAPTGGASGHVIVAEPDTATQIKGGTK